MKPSNYGGRGFIVARHDGDVAILPETVPYWSDSVGSWVKKEARDSLHWFVFDDRKMYQPGEEVHVKGWIRRVAGGKTGDIGPLGDAATQVTYVLNDSRGNLVKTGNLSLNAFGGFDWAVKLPDRVESWSHDFEVASRGSARDNTSSTTAFRCRNFAGQSLKLRRRLKMKDLSSLAPAQTFH